MNPIEFPEQTGKLARNQPGYRVLPIFQSVPDPNGVCQWTGKYELSELEIAAIIKTKCLWFSQFGNCFHPIMPQVHSPFVAIKIDYKIMDGVYYYWLPMQSGTIHQGSAATPVAVIDQILETFSNLQAEHLYFEEKPALGVDKDGNITGL